MHQMCYLKQITYARYIVYIVYKMYNFFFFQALQG